MFIPQKWLRLQFTRHIRRGFSQNAEVNPSLTELVRLRAESTEEFPVSVMAKTGVRYWLTDRRIIAEDGDNLRTLFRYEEVSQVHWMFKDWLQRAFKATNPQDEITRIKSVHFDRLEVELKSTGEMVVLEELDQSYLPVYEFLSLLWRLNVPRTP